MLGRMESGDGARVPLDAWARVAIALETPLFAEPHDDSDVYLAAIERLFAGGAWTVAERLRGELRLERPVRPSRSSPRVQLPAERIIVRARPLVIDPYREWERTRDAADAARRASSPGLVVQGLLVLVRTGHNLRRLGARQWMRRSVPGWLGAARDPAVAVPDRTGWLWLTPRGTHLLPMV